MNCDEFGREIPGGINGNVGSSFDDTTNMNMLRSKGRDDDDSPKDPGATAGSTGINANGATNHTRGNHYNKRSVKNKSRQPFPCKQIVSFDTPIKIDNRKLCRHQHGIMPGVYICSYPLIGG
jgi:hypothetical protein